MSGIRCKICSSSRRGAVEEGLRRGLSVRDCAAQFNFSRSSVDRHHRHCMSLVVGRSEPDARQSCLRGLYERLERILTQAERRKDHRAAVDCAAKLFEIQKQIILSETPKKQIQIRIVDSRAPIRNRQPLSDEQLIEELGKLIRRTKSELVMGTAAKLAFLLKGRPVPAEVEAMAEQPLLGAGSRE